jgi:AraC-like DNA-binding protein
VTTSDNKTHKLIAQTAVFLPQGMNLHSDYVKATENLKAYLVFFSDDIITDFVSAQPKNAIIEAKQAELLTINCGNLIPNYFNSIQFMNTQAGYSAELVRIKLLELLHILTLYDNGFLHRVIQSTTTVSSPKRNLARLLSNSDVLKLTINDLANLSGRSISTFTRDFKVIYDVTPKRWLQNKRLIRANELLTNTELSVTHIAADLGYENVSHFIKSFKNKYKITPKQFQQGN